MKKLRYIRLLAVGLLVALAPACSAGSGGDDELDRVSVGVVSPGSPLQWWTTMADALGHFEAEGIRVDQPQFKGGINGVQAVLGGNIEFNQAIFDQVVKSQAQGQELVMIALSTDTPMWSWVVPASEKDTYGSVEDMRGAALGVTAPGSGSDIWTRTWLSDNGLQPEKDVGVLSTGTGMELQAAMDAGQVAGGVQLEPFTTQLLESGKIHAVRDALTEDDVEELVGFAPYPMMGIVASRSYIDSHPEIVQRVVNAYVRTYRWVDSHSDTEVAEALPEEYVSDPELMAKVVGRIRSGFTETGMLDLESAEKAIEYLRRTDQVPTTEALDASAMVDMTFVEQALRDD